MIQTNPKRAGPRKTRPPTKGIKPIIKTKTTTDDVATGPRTDAFAVGGGGGGGASGAGGAGEEAAAPPRRVMNPGSGLNIAALAMDQKVKELLNQ